MTTRRDAIGLLAAAPFAAGCGITGASRARAQPAQSSETGSADWQTSPDGRAFEEYRVCFSKGLKHRSDGYPEPELYAAFCKAIQARDANALGQMKLSTRWVDPLAGTKLCSAEVLGSHAGQWFGTNLMYGDVAEVYWASLCRDIPFSAYGNHSLINRADAELKRIDSRRFSRPPFSIDLPGTGEGGYLSQFLIKPVPLNGAALFQRILCPTPSNDFLSEPEQWMRCQNADRLHTITTHLPAPRYIFNGRALAEFVRHDFSFQAFLWAGLILESWGRRALNKGLPERHTHNSAAFANNGWPQVFALLAQASQRALEDAWFWKWRVFRRLRPEEIAGRDGLMSLEFPDEGVGKISLLEGAAASKKKFGTALLTQSYPDGTPLHPSFPSGHAQIAGACVTVLKAFTNPDFLIPAPLLPSDDGLDIVSYDGDLLLEGELNKLAWNMSFGRTFAGIHYRSDHEGGLILGEDIALKLLAEAGRKVVGERSTLWFRRFDGNWTSVAI
ncbi:MAG: vanadium-dependent haloperoxidase [Anaerolineales bacterium]